MPSQDLDLEAQNPNWQYEAAVSSSAFVGYASSLFSSHLTCRSIGQKFGYAVAGILITAAAMGTYRAIFGPNEIKRFLNQRWCQTKLSVFDEEISDEAFSIFISRADDDCVFSEISKDTFTFSPILGYRHISNDKNETITVIGEGIRLLGEYDFVDENIICECQKY